MSGLFIGTLCGTLGCLTLHDGCVLFSLVQCVQDSFFCYDDGFK